MRMLLVSAVAAVGIVLGAPFGIAPLRAAEFKISPDSVWTQYSAKLASRGSRGLIAAWNILLSGSYRFRSDVVVQRFTSAGDKIGSPVNLMGLVPRHQFVRGIAALKDGRYVVVWDSDTGAGFDVMAQRFSAAGVEIGNAFRVNSTAPGDQAFAATAALSNGGFVIAWAWGGHGIYGQRYNANGAKVGGQFKISTYAYASQTTPHIATLPNGGFVLVWASKQEGGNANYGIRGQRFSAAGAKVGPEFQINTYTRNDQKAPQVAAFRNNTFVVVWTSTGQDRAGAGVYLQRFTANGGKLGQESRVNTVTAGDQNEAVVAVLGSDQFVVLWKHMSDGSGTGVFGQRHTVAGAKVGGHFRVNETRPGNQGRPAIAAHTLNSFVAAWDSQQQLGGIFGKAFAQ